MPQIWELGKYLNAQIEVYINFSKDFFIKNTEAQFLNMSEHQCQIKNNPNHKIQGRNQI